MESSYKLLNALNKDRLKRTLYTLSFALYGFITALIMLTHAAQ